MSERCLLIQEPRAIGVDILVGRPRARLQHLLLRLRLNGIEQHVREIGAGLDRRRRAMVVTLCRALPSARLRAQRCQ